MTRSYFSFNFLEGVIGCEYDFKTSTVVVYTIDIMRDTLLKFNSIEPIFTVEGVAMGYMEYRLQNPYT